MSGKTQQKRKSQNLLRNMITTKYVAIACGCVNKKGEKENEKTTHGRVYIKNCCGVK